MTHLTFKPLLIAAAATTLVLTGTSLQAQTVFNKVKERGFVNCGASQGVPGLSRPDEKGAWTGFDVDMCRAVAVAMFGDKSKARFTPLNAAQRLPAVQTGEVDLLTRTTTLTFNRDMGVRFVTAYLFDSDALLVKKSSGAKTKKDLKDITVCLQGGGSLVEKALDSMAAKDGIPMKRVYFDSTIQARDAYFAGRCDSYITDGLAAAGQRAAAKNPDEHVMIYSSQTKEALGAAIARGDDKWFDVVRWSINTLHWAEEQGITQANVDEKVRNGTAAQKLVLGGTAGWGKTIGLDDKWAYNIIKQLGNYGEIFENNLGKNSPLKASRGLNNNVENGGAMVAFPMEY